MPTTIRLIVVLALAFAQLASADVPRRIGYQGYLTSGGAPVNGSVQVSFALYAAALGGPPLWTETQTVVADKGIISVVLGSSTAFPSGLSFDAPYYLGISTSSDPEMTPRTALLSSGTALTASVALSVAPASLGGAALGITCAQGQFLAYTATGWGCSSLVCGFGTTPCGAACVNRKSDAANCGACGNACAASHPCIAGVCN